MKIKIMTPEVRKLVEKLNKLATDMRKLHKKAEDEERGFEPDEREKWDKWMADYDATEKRLQVSQQASALEDYSDVAVNDPETRGKAAGSPAAQDPDAGGTQQRDFASLTKPKEIRVHDDYKKAFRAYMLAGSTGIADSHREILSRGMSGDWGEWGGAKVSAELRAQGVATGAAGGFLVPEDFAGFITETVKDFSGLMDAADQRFGPTRLDTGRGNNLPFPTNDDTANAGVILTENTAVTEQDAVLGERTLGAFMYSSRLIRVSLQLLQDEDVNLEQFLGRLLGTRLGRALSPHLAAGVGTTEPTGLTTASTASGVGVSVGAGFTYNNLIDIEHAVDPGYRRRNAAWVFGDAFLAVLKKIVDANGRPLWLPGLAGFGNEGGVALSTIDGFPFVIDQGMPAFANGLRYIAFGDLTQYFIRVVLGMQLFRFNERFMDFHQIGFLGFARWDGNLIDTAAVVHDQAVL